MRKFHARRQKHALTYHRKAKVRELKVYSLITPNHPFGGYTSMRLAPQTSNNEQVTTSHYRGLQREIYKSQVERLFRRGSIHLKMVFSTNCTAKVRDKKRVIYSWRLIITGVLSPFRMNGRGGRSEPVAVLLRPLQ